MIDRKRLEKSNYIRETSTDPSNFGPLSPTNESHSSIFQLLFLIALQQSPKIFSTLHSIYAMGLTPLISCVWREKREWGIPKLDGKLNPVHQTSHHAECVRFYMNKQMLDLGITVYWCGQPKYLTLFFCFGFEYKALFRSKKFLDFDTIALSFLFDKHCPIME